MSLLLGWTVANPPETVRLCVREYIVKGRSVLTKPLLGPVPSLYDLDDARTQGFYRRDVIGQNAHVTCRSRDIDLDDIR